MEKTGGTPEWRNFISGDEEGIYLLDTSRMDEQGEGVILEQDRFFLSEEGIGIHFDAYELECHPPEVVWDIVVPYSAFELRESSVRLSE